MHICARSNVRVAGYDFWGSRGAGVEWPLVTVLTKHRLKWTRCEPAARRDHSGQGRRQTQTDMDRTGVTILPLSHWLEPSTQRQLQASDKVVETSFPRDCDMNSWFNVEKYYNIFISNAPPHHNAKRGHYRDTKGIVVHTFKNPY